MHRIGRLILALLLSTLAACSDPPPPVVEEAILPDYSHIVCKPSVHPFWTKFRDAVLKEDWEAVAGLTRFPLGLVRHKDFKGDDISRQDFVKQLPQFLDAVPVHGYPGVEPKPTSMLALIKAVSVLDKKACGNVEGTLVIGEWVFFLRANGWRLHGVYVPEFPAFMKHIPIQPLKIIKD